MSRNTHSIDAKRYPGVNTSVTFTAGESEVIDLQGASLSGFITSGSEGSADVTFEVSVDGTTWLELRDATNVAVGVTIDSTTARAYTLDDNILGLSMWRYVKIFNGAHGNTWTVIGRIYN